MRIIHCADLHLGCCPEGNASRFEDFCSAFGAICRLTLEQRAQALVIAGDFFHQRSIEPNTLAAAVTHLTLLKEHQVTVIAIEGNHDKAFYSMRQSWMEYLNGAGLIRLLKPIYVENQPHLSPYAQEQGAIFLQDGVRFVGFGYLGGATRVRLESMRPQLSPYEGFTVGLLHTGVDNLRGLDLGAITSADLEPYRGLVDYFALGHVHTRWENGWAFNPGAPESVHLAESRNGEKGCYLIETQGKSFRAEYLPVPRRPVHCCSVDATNMAQEQVLSAALRAFSSAQPGDMGLMQLTGRASAPLELDTLKEALCRSLGLLLLEIRDETQSGQCGACGGHSFSLQELERRVMGQLAQERGKPACLGDLALTACGALLERQPPQQLYALLEAYLRQEAAGEEGETCALNP